MSQQPDISVIVVTWNTREMTLGCLEALYANDGGCDLEVFVVDNGSLDGTAEAIAQRYPQVRLIANEDNRGFAAANNQAMQDARGRYVFLLNSDAIVDDGTLRELVGFMDAELTVGMAGAQLVSRDGKLENCASVFPTLAMELLNKSLLRALNPGRYGAGRTQGATEPVVVESVLGACMIVRAEAIDRVGMLDDGFFFFLEETDWCRRMRDAGWGIYLVPKARAVHLKGKSKAVFRARAKVEYHRSLYRYFGKHHGTFMAVTLRVGKTLRHLLNLLMLSVGNVATLGLGRRLRAKLAMSAVVLGWHLGLCPRGYGLPRTKRELRDKQE